MPNIKLPQRQKQTIVKILFALAIILFFAYNRATKRIHIPNYAIVSCFCYLSLLYLWLHSIKARIIDKNIRGNILIVAYLLVMLMVLRTVKWTIDSHFLLEQLLWYGYYIPIILIPLYLLRIVLALDQNLYLKYQMLLTKVFYFDVVLILIVLTNSWHQLIFKIIEWHERYDVIEYQLGFKLLSAYLILKIIIMIWLLFINSKLPRTNDRIILPSGVFAIYLGYNLFYTFNPTAFGVGFIEFALMVCLATISFIESFIFVGLIPSNTYYQELFENSELPIMIIDEDYEIKKTSKLGTGLSKKIYRKMQSGDVIDLGESRACMKKVTDGYVVWLDDISAINQKNREIEAANNELLLENKLLVEQIELEKKEIALREKNRIYEEIERIIAPKRQEIDSLVASITLDNRDVQLRRICLIGAYIKRISNIILLERMFDNINAIELENAINESLLNFKLNHNVEQTREFIDFKLNGVDVRKVYQYLQEQLEFYLDIDCDLVVQWRIENNDFCLSLQILGDQLLISDSSILESELKILGISLERYSEVKGLTFNLKIRGAEAKTNVSAK